MSDDEESVVKILKMPPRTIKAALIEIAEVYGEEMNHFVIVGNSKEGMPFCYTSSDQLAQLAVAKLTLDIAIHDIVERLHEEV